jgi:hypothetical protein
MPSTGIFLHPWREMAAGRRKAVRYHAWSRRSGRVAEGGALLRRYVGEHLHRGFESLLLRSEGWQSGRMRRSRKPLSVVRRIEGSNPSPSAEVGGIPLGERDSGLTYRPLLASAEHAGISPGQGATVAQVSRTYHSCGFWISPRASVMTSGKTVARNTLSEIDRYSVATILSFLAVPPGCGLKTTTPCGSFANSYPGGL